MTVGWYWLSCCIRGQMWYNAWIVGKWNMAYYITTCKLNVPLVGAIWLCLYRHSNIIPPFEWAASTHSIYPYNGYAAVRVDQSDLWNRDDYFLAETQFHWARHNSSIRYRLIAWAKIIAKVGIGSLLYLKSHLASRVNVNESAVCAGIHHEPNDCLVIHLASSNILIFVKFKMSLHIAGKCRSPCGHRWNRRVNKMVSFRGGCIS